MIKYVFNTKFEISMRVILILALSKNSLTIETITNIDFISTYSKEFGLTNKNLHGNNEFKFCEYSGRRSLVLNAVKDLVVKKLILFSYSSDGFKYSISETGLRLCNSLKSDYSKEYKINIEISIPFVLAKTEKELLDLFCRNSSTYLEE